MENYTKGETRKVYDPPLLSMEGAMEMRVSHGSKLRNLLGVALPALETDAGRHVIWYGTDNAISKAISCAEITKRKLKGLHQITQIGVLRSEDYWEPSKPGLDTLKVNTNTPAISILLSKDPLDTNHPSYQAPGSNSLKWTGNANSASRRRNKSAVLGVQKAATKDKKKGRSDKKLKPQSSSSSFPKPQ